ncbi:hypothetical protein BD289DRAFT_450773 [Coniella lustricola]|uniref:DNA/RNA-binding protein Alba-like domain-containing protein n=1 Tax=Coniella lustricola TaxID=2025994 RepID=A0A2T3AHG0_9PEZI|nr:hypothetical protein BD289DRAFT_450773 [Coniella lustricola]
MSSSAGMSSSSASAQPPSSSRTSKRRHHDDEPENSTNPTQIAASGAVSDPINIDPDQVSITHKNHRSRKKRHVGPSTSSIPRTLPMEAHNELISELQTKYSIITASIISSSKIQKKVTTVLSHLGHVDLFNTRAKPGVMMLHARAGDAGKMVTVMELAKRRMSEAGTVWYQYNRVYQTAREADKAHGKGASRDAQNVCDVNQTVVEDTVMDDAIQDEDQESDEEDIFEPVEAALYAAIRDKPAAESKATYMSIFLSRVPIVELQSKSFITIQTNAGEAGQGRKV